ncbi:hypothetical protein DFH07DRAFT_954570 [Mycena maculata]|uniref:Uncharacterized protein n=1 Tax=Mycena maculata TaxID=230809 RepID=A0AAD7JNS0_9AGAR|nr:hypothetical protein DFH07DRAFT_954570 [Mycena maculata]
MPRKQASVLIPESSWIGFGAGGTLDEAYKDWKKMGKKEFMEMYGNDVLEYYDILSQEEINALPKSNAEDDEEEVEIDLEDTEDKMEVEETLGS